MLTEKQQRQKAQLREHYRRLLCTKCGTMMTDFEPGSPKGEFNHRNNGCQYSNRLFFWERPVRSKYWPKGMKWSHEASGIVQMNYSSKERRARKRGAKLASKHRPK